MTIQKSILQDIECLYATKIPEASVQIQKTKKEFQGHLTLVVFPLLKISKKNPEQTATEIGEYLIKNQPAIAGFHVIKGFLNLTVSPVYWIEVLNAIHQNPHYGTREAHSSSPLVMIEYSSPNTNKPLHLGHIRNNLLGYSISEILKATGHRVVKTNIVNDRGIHICKSMLAWKLWGKGETPESSGKKGDHLIGEYYVKFDQEYKKELAEWEASGRTKKEAEEHSTLMAEVREMLRKWEAGDEETVSLWEKMNSWAYAGFEETYQALGVNFDKIYYESQTYLDGKAKVLEGLQQGIFYQKDDGSVWADLTSNGLDEKVLLRADGTSVYMTQDIGTAKQRFDDYPIDTMVYVVGNEQNYHFQVLSLLLDRLGFSFGKGLVHFSYGMVELPEGKMKSREGTVVDADDLIDEMIRTAREISNELGKLDACSEEEADEVVRTVGLGALKYFILKVDPRKNMVFNPKESIDFNGNTGPFIQYTYARIQSVLRKVPLNPLPLNPLPLNPLKGTWEEACSAESKSPLQGVGGEPLNPLKGTWEKACSAECQSPLQGVGGEPLNPLKGTWEKACSAESQSPLQGVGGGTWEKACSAECQSPLQGVGGGLNDKEITIIQLLSEFPSIVQEAADTFSPAVIANYIYELVKEYNQFYHDYSILGEADENVRKFRLVLSENTGKVIRTGCALLGIDVPERM